MKRIFSAFLCAIGLTTSANAQPMTENEFTHRFANVLTSEAITLKVKVAGKMELTLIDDKGKETTAFLDNAYSEYLLNPKEEKEVIEKYVRALLEPKEDDAALDSTRIVPVVKDLHWVTEIQESVKARSGRNISENVYETLNEELVIVYAEDTPKNIRYFSPEDLKKAGIKKSDLKNIATKNLREIIPNIEVHSGPHVSMITAGGDYEASLLLIEDLWMEKVKVDGEVVVAIPSRDLLVVTGSKDVQGLTKLHEIADKIHKEAPYPLTNKLFVYRNERLLPLENL